MGSSLTLTMGVSVSFPFPLSRLVPRVLPLSAVELPSLIFCKEFEREIDGSSSMTIMTGSESRDIGRGVGSIGPSLARGGSGADEAPFWLRAEARWARPVALLFVARPIVTCAAWQQRLNQRWGGEKTSVEWSFSMQKWIEKRTLYRSVLVSFEGLQSPV